MGRFTLLQNPKNAYLIYQTPITLNQLEAGAYLGAFGDAPSRRTPPFFTKKSTGTVHGRLMQGLMLQAHLGLL